ncbi:Uncharacterised protein [Segatella copri]|nr:Uncharacterised protein [Segatella copri]
MKATTWNQTPSMVMVSWMPSEIQLRNKRITTSITKHGS